VRRLRGRLQMFYVCLQVLTMSNEALPQTVEHVVSCSERGAV